MADIYGLPIWLAMVLIIFLWAGIGAGGMILYYKWIKYRIWPKTVVIFEERANAIFPIIDWGKTIKTAAEGIYIKLQDSKLVTPPIRLKTRMITKGGRDLILLFSPAVGEYYPVVFDPKAKEMKIIPEDMKHMLTLGLREVDLKYPIKVPWVTTWLPIIAGIATICAMAAFLWIAGNQMILIAAQAQEVAGGAAMKALGPAIEQLSTITEAIKSATSGVQIPGIAPGG